ncbi:MAG: hypothetical protein E7571_04730 [Ruminococcaceae bacterium]|nr:hypothetical protein [Oscillospiraceae bacterium]
MECSLAKATAFCVEHRMCLDESPATSSRASFQEAFIVENNKVPGTRSKSVILSSGRVLNYAVFVNLPGLKSRKNELEKVDIFP